MDKLRLAVTILVGCFIAIGIWGIILVNNIILKIIMFIFAIICGLIMYLIIYYWYGKDYKCPFCNHRFCLVKTGEEIINKEYISVSINTNTKNKYGDIIGTQEQYVPGERITYRINKICTKCKQECYSICKREIPYI